MSIRLGVYAGSFDPPTVGHLWMIEQGAALFDRLQVAVGSHPEKRALFSVPERRAMLAEMTAHLRNVEIASFEQQYLIRHAQAIGATFILRGIRSGTDYEYERGMRNVNGDLGPQVTTVFLMPPRGIAEVSSSMVKGLMGPEGWQDVVSSFVPPAVLERLAGKARLTGA